LRTLLGDHPGTAALKSGALTSDLVAFDFADYSPTNKGFKPMVREGAFDVSEMAIVTYLMAKSFGKPMVLLPVFWDQYDNAQRVDEIGRGVRLDTYAFEDDELRGAIDRLLGDRALRARLGAAAAALCAARLSGARVAERLAELYAAAVPAARPRGRSPLLPRGRSPLLL
jgi:hypothetical protein